MTEPAPNFSSHWAAMAELFRAEFQRSNSAGERAFFARMVARCELRAKLNFDPRGAPKGNVRR